MSNCKIINGIDAQVCRDATPGVKRFFISNFENVTEYVESEVSGVTSITMDAGEYFYEFRPNKNGGSFGQNISETGDKGGVLYEHTVNMIFSKNEQSDINTIKLLARANLIIIVETRRGNYYMLGKNEGLQMVDTTYQSGQGGTDETNWNLNFTGEDWEPFVKVDSDVIDTITE